MRHLAPDALFAAQKLKMTPRDYVAWWDSSKEAPAPFGPYIRVVNKKIELTREMHVLGNVLVEKEYVNIVCNLSN